MKKVSLIWAMSLTLFLLSSCTHRLGTIAVASTREIDSKIEYVLLKSDVTGKAKDKENDDTLKEIMEGTEAKDLNDDPIEKAINKAVKKVPNGVFLKDCTIGFKGNSKKFVVTGDVWGLPVTNSPTNK